MLGNWYTNLEVGPEPIKKASVETQCSIPINSKIKLSVPREDDA